MFIDARELATDAVLQADVCIVGAGPAGITLAREFIGLQHSVALLESGGLRLDPGLQTLGQPAKKWHPQAGPLAARRQYGGNANAWTVHTVRGHSSVRLARLSESDFEARDWIADSGWPIRRADLDAYYDRARRVFRLDAGGYEVADWEGPGSARLPVPADLETSMFQFASARVFTHDYRGELKRAQNVRLYHHATALELETVADASAVTAVRCASYPGREFRIRAQSVVLACGGMAVPQLLLLSDGAQPGGLGNAHDLVGRYYMDHPLLRGGRFIPATPGLVEAMTLYDLRTVHGVPVMGHLQIAAEGQRRERLPQLSMLFFPRPEDWPAGDAIPSRQQAGVQAVRRLKRSLKRGTPPSGADLRQALLGIDGIALQALRDVRTPETSLRRGGWSDHLGSHHPYGVFEVVHQAEQPPHRENRVYLGNARDGFGSRKLAVDWSWSEEDMAATMRSQEFFAESLERAGLGRFEIERPDGRPRVISNSTAHYMGTTRMHSDAKRGVVDADFRVHGVRNLFVASSSVFTTGGFANPTLTIVALSLRVGDYLRLALESGMALL